jgi:signal transduction histidine kinase/CheY-like chemotaxis protein
MVSDGTAAREGSRGTTSTVQKTLERMGQSPTRERADAAFLAGCIEATRSEFAFLAGVWGDSLVSWAVISDSQIVPNVLDRYGMPSVLCGDSCLFSEAARTGLPVFASGPHPHCCPGLCPSSLPQYFVGLPIQRAGVTIGMIGLGSQHDHYPADIAQRLAPFLDLARLTLGERREQEQLVLDGTRARALIELTENVLLLVGPDQRIRYASPNFSRLFGYDAPVGMIRPPPHPDDEALLNRFVGAAMEQPGVPMGEGVGGVTVRILAAHGGYVELEGHIINMMHDAAVGGIVFQGHDAGPRRRAERASAKLHAQVLQAQKLDSLGVLAGGIAHDFNNLLVAIMGNIALARSAIGAGTNPEHALNQAENASQRAADLCGQMLAYSGRGRFVVEPVDLSQMIEAILQLLSISIGKKAVLKLSLGTRLPLIEAEANQVRQVILNLVTNAGEAIGDSSGLVTITTGSMECDREYLRESYMDDKLPTGKYVYVEVADTGCGMDTATRERIFEPFFTTKFTGRGLGLAAVLGIVRGHRGAIKISSDVGHGSTLRVLLPALARTQPRTEAPPVRETERPVSGTVLVIDDETNVRDVTARMLELAGFRVLTAPDGRAALPIYREHMNGIDVVLVDMTMPHLDGPDTFRALRRIRPDVKVVLTSGYSEQDALSGLADEGLCGFLQKPYRPGDLISTLQRAQRQRR